MADLDAVRALLPVWVRGAGWTLLPVALAIGFAVTALAARVALPRRRTFAAAHWTERARATFPARWVATISGCAVGASLAGVAAHRAGALVSVPVWLVTLGAGMAAYLGAMLAVARLESQVGIATGPRLRFAFGRLGLLFVTLPQVVVIVALSCVVDGQPGAKNFVAAALGVSAYALLAIWGGLPLAHVFGALHPASPKLRGAVERAAAKTGSAARAVYEIELPITNAFALPVPRWLVFTRRCVTELSEHELECVACHELGHLSEPTAVTAARVGATFSLLPLGFALAFVQAFGVLLGLGIVYAAMFGVAIPMRALSRRMEARADAVAGHHAEDAAVYAAALERLHQSNLAPAVGWSAGGTHPHLYDRMEAAGVAPAYPRPQPPSRVRAALGAAAGLAVVTLLTTVLASLGSGNALAPERRAVVDVALFGGSAADFFQLAAYDERREPREALAFLRASLALRPLDHAAQALMAEKLVAEGQCAEAWLAIQAALDTLERQRWDHARECGWVARATEALEACE